MTGDRPDRPPAVTYLPGRAEPTRRRELAGVMGVRGSVTVVGVADPALAEHLLELAERRLRTLEGRWSRFLDASEVSRLGHARGRATPVSEATRTLVRALVDAWRATDGVFDPTRLPDLVEHGYGASVIDVTRVTTIPAGARRTYDLDEVVVDDDAGTVRLPAGATLDPGGIGKGLAADLVTAELLDRGAAGAMVEVGGDLRVSGRSPDGPGWRIDVEHPFLAGGPPVATVSLAEGGVATSSRLRRRWQGPDGLERHHLLDPRTGRPSTGDVVTATVATATGAWSEAFTKVPAVLGARDGLAVLEQGGLAALLVTTDGSVLTTSAWSALTATHPVPTGAPGATGAAP